MQTTILSMPELPPTLNEIIGVARRNKFASAGLKKKWHKKIEPYVSAMKKVPGKVYVECVWIVKNRRRDPDNICAATKYIFDVMVEYGRIDNDNMKVIQSPIIHHFVPGNYDGFIIYFRDKEDFVSRLKQDISVPPNNFSGSTNQQSFLARSVQKATNQ
jgi:hypothetical protein